MITATVTAFVDADPEAVFRTVVDPHRLPEWNQAISRVVEAPDALEAGAEWVVEMHAMAQHWPSRSRVQVLDSSARHFTYRSATDDGNPSFGLWSWKVFEDRGGSRVTVSWELEPKTFWRRSLFAHIRGHQLLETEVPASLTALGAVARKAKIS